MLYTLIFSSIGQTRGLALVSSLLKLTASDSSHQPQVCLVPWDHEAEEEPPTHTHTAKALETAASHLSLYDNLLHFDESSKQPSYDCVGLSKQKLLVTHDVHVSYVESGTVASVKAALISCQNRCRQWGDLKFSPRTVTTVLWYCVLH